MKSIHAIGLTAALSLSLHLPSNAQRAAKFTMFDEGTEDESLMGARAAAQQVVAVRDIKGFSAILAPDITSGFNEIVDRGRERLIARYRLSDRNSPVWEDLALILTLGGGYDTLARDTFVMPYVAASRQIRIEWGWCVAVGWVNAYDKPTLGATQITTLNGDLVPVDSSRSNDAWQAVRYEEGRIGFVRRPQCRSGHELRIYFGRTANGWRINAIVAGD